MNYEDEDIDSCQSSQGSQLLRRVTNKGSKEQKQTKDNKHSQTFCSIVYDDGNDLLQSKNERLFIRNLNQTHEKQNAFQTHQSSEKSQQFTDKNQRMQIYFNSSQLQKFQNIESRFQRNNQQQVSLNNLSQNNQMGTIIFTQQTIREKQRQMDKNEVILYIFEAAIKNKTYGCQLAHFLIPFGLIILDDYSRNHDEQSFIMKIHSYIKDKLTRPLIKKQISEQRFNQYYDFLTNYKNVDHQSAINMLRKFLQREGSLAHCVCPYYYNLFALVVNKEIIFGGNRNEELVQYSVQYSHNFYDENFSRKNVMREIENMQEILVKAYNSDRI